MKRKLIRFLAIFIAVLFTLQTIQQGHAQKKPSPILIDPSRAEIKEENTAPVAASASKAGDKGIKPNATGAEVEPNDTSGTATSLTFRPSTITTAAVNPGGDLDCCPFTGPAGARVWIVTDTGGTQNAGATSRDTVIDLLAADGTTVIENDDDDGTGNGGDGTI